MISLEVSDVADAKWNKRLEDASLVSIHQANEFAIARIKKDSEGKLFSQDLLK